MARDSRRTSRSGVAPGRGTPRTRATPRSSAPRSGAAASNRAHEQATQPAGLTLPTLHRSIGITRRAIALLVVVALLAVSYAGSLRIYWGQQHDIGMYQQQIDEHNAAIGNLQDQLGRWDDDNYVRAQARSRLGWVMPGETSYVVLGADNRPIQGSGQLGAARATGSNANMTWWQKLWDSLQTADQPVAPERTATRTAPVGEPDQPSASPTK